MTCEATQFGLKSICLGFVWLCLHCSWSDRIDKQTHTLLTANRLHDHNTYKHTTWTATHHHTQLTLWLPSTLFNSGHVWTLETRPQQHGGMEAFWVFKLNQSTRKVIANEYNSSIITSGTTDVKLNDVTRTLYSIHSLLLRKHSEYFQDIMNRDWSRKGAKTILLQDIDVEQRECGWREHGQAIMLDSQCANRLVI